MVLLTIYTEKKTDSSLPARGTPRCRQSLKRSKTYCRTVGPYSGCTSLASWSLKTHGAVGSSISEVSCPYVLQRLQWSQDLKVPSKTPSPELFRLKLFKKWSNVMLSLRTCSKHPRCLSQRFILSKLVPWHSKSPRIPHQEFFQLLSPLPLLIRLFPTAVWFISTKKKTNRTISNTSFYFLSWHRLVTEDFYLSAWPPPFVQSLLGRFHCVSAHLSTRTDPYLSDQLDCFSNLCLLEVWICLLKSSLRFLVKFLQKKQFMKQLFEIKCVFYGSFTICRSPVPKRFNQNSSRSPPNTPAGRRRRASAGSARRRRALGWCPWTEVVGAGTVKKMELLICYIPIDPNMINWKIKEGFKQAINLLEC